MRTRVDTQTSDDGDLLAVDGTGQRATDLLHARRAESTRSFGEHRERHIVDRVEIDGREPSNRIVAGFQYDFAVEISNGGRPRRHGGPSQPFDGGVARERRLGVARRPAVRTTRVRLAGGARTASWLRARSPSHHTHQAHREDGCRSRERTSDGVGDDNLVDTVRDVQRQFGPRLVVGRDDFEDERRSRNEGGVGVVAVDAEVRNAMSSDVPRLNGPLTCSPCWLAQGVSNTANRTSSRACRFPGDGAMWYSPFQTSSWRSAPVARRRSIGSASAPGRSPSTTVRMPQV